MVTKMIHMVTRFGFEARIKHNPGLGVKPNFGYFVFDVFGFPLSV